MYEMVNLPDKANGKDTTCSSEVTGWGYDGHYSQKCQRHHKDFSEQLEWVTQIQKPPAMPNSDWLASGY